MKVIALCSTLAAIALARPQPDTPSAGASPVILHAKGSTLPVDRLLLKDSSLNHTVKALVGQPSLDGNASIISAARNGDLPLLQALASHGADARANFDEPLVAAAGKGHADVVDHLLASGADINAREGAPLTAAAASGDLQMVQHLIIRGATPNAYFDMALITAAAEGHLAIVRLLVQEHGANVRARDYGALFAASAKGHVEVVEFLLSFGSKDNPLILVEAMRKAALNGHKDLVALFEQHGASWAVLWDYSYKDHWISYDSIAEEPIELVLFAIQSNLLEFYLKKELFRNSTSTGRFDLARLALDNVQLNASTVCWAIEKSINATRLDSVNFIMDTIKDELSEECLDCLVEAALRTGSAELANRFEAMGGKAKENSIGHVVSSAAGSGSVDRLAWLESRGLAIAPHAQGAMHTAIRSGSVAMVESLVKYGASLKDRDASKYFRTAVKGSNVAMLQFLMERFPGQRVNYKKCFMAAAENNSAEMIDFIRSKGFSVTKHARKAVLKAAAGGNIEMIRYLISIGADVTAGGDVVLGSAIDHGRDEVVRFLFAYDGGVYFDKLALATSSILERKFISSTRFKLLLKLSNDIPINLPALLAKATKSQLGQHFMKMILAYIKAEDRKGAATEALVTLSLQSSTMAERIVSFLFDQGADVTAYNNQAAFNAASIGSLESARLLLKLGASLRERADEAAVIAASNRGSLERLTFLFLNGASIDVCGRAALQAATDNKQRNAILFLQERMAIATLPNN